MVNDISRRGLFRIGGGIAVASALGGTLAACGGTGAGTSSGDLTMTWWGSDARHAAYNKALAAFQKSNPDIKIKAAYSGFDGYFNKFNTQVAGGSVPDLVQMDTALVAQYAQKGVLAPLDEYVGKTLDTTGFSKEILAAGTVDGKLYGMPSGLGVNVLTMNASGIKELKLELPDNEWTWEDLKTFAVKVSEASNGKLFGVDDAGGSVLQAFEIFAREHNQPLYTADGKLGFNEATLEEWWTYWAEMRKLKAAPAGAATSAAHNDLTKNGVVLGKNMLTFDIGVDSSSGSLTTATLDQVLSPRGNWSGAIEGQYVSGGVLLSATKSSKRVEDSTKIISYIAQDETAIKDMMLLRGIPPTEKARTAVAPLVTDFDKRRLAAAEYVSKRLAKATDALPAPGASPEGSAEVGELLFQTNLAIAFGKKSIKDALKEFFDQANGILSK